MAQPTTIKSGLKIEDVSPAAPKRFSTFEELSHRFLQTHRFGEITPHCAFATVKGAKDSFRCMNDTSTYSLKAPLKTDMFQKRSNFFVPLQAILYNNWELLVAQPNQGDDVPSDVNGIVSQQYLHQFLNTLASRINTFVISEDSGLTPTNDYITMIFRNILVMESFMSQGSLMKQLGIDFSHLFIANWYDAANTRTVPKSFDAFSEHILSALAPTSDTSQSRPSGFTVTWIDEDDNPTDVYKVRPAEFLAELPARGDNYISYRHFLDLARQNLNFYISDFYFQGVGANIFEDPETEDDEYYVYALTSDFSNAVFGGYLEDGRELNIRVGKEADFPDNINFNRLSAYQICCAHFFSIDHVDYIYSAQLYRQLQNFYQKQFVPSATFSWNGVLLDYDALSGHAITSCLINASLAVDIVLDSDYHFSAPLAYFTNLFSFRHSLRYLDYFTGGRTRPLSVGDVGVAVNDGQVNAVDMIIKQNAARYLNFAQRVGRKISQWLEQLLPGGQPKPDMHDPQWLSSTGDALTPEQVQNTAAAQAEKANSITANLKNNSNRYQFTLQPDRPGYVICVTYYDLPRAYAYATDRENYHVDRYDMFNPFFQYNGSQEVKKSELGLAGNLPFSYQNKYSEYKQKYDIVAGGFVENLPGFAFIADVQSGLPMQINLNPTYIRSWNCELDPFYLSLTGYGLAAYFHFIVKNVNIIKGVRPMEYAPQLM